MSEIDYVETVDSELEPIIEQFLENSRSELVQMRKTYADGDMDTLGRLGHSMKGAGLGFGFLGMGQLGRELEQAGKTGDRTTCARLLDELAEYLDNVRVVYA